MALMHYPVINKNGKVIASAITNLDLHDIARVAKTYGVEKFYVVTPLKDQQDLIHRIVSHWTKGIGSRYNPKRRQALETIQVGTTLGEILQDIAKQQGQAPKSVATSAQPAGDVISFQAMRQMLTNGIPHLLLFGTAWGLSDACIEAADYRLASITGNTGYNHLSVRSASAIILDRLLGGRNERS